MKEHPTAIHHLLIFPPVEREEIELFIMASACILFLTSQPCSQQIIILSYLGKYGGFVSLLLPISILKEHNSCY